VRKKRMKKEIAVASFFIVIGLYVIYSSLSMSIWRKSVPEEGFLPFVLACILIGLSTILLIDAFRKEEKGGSVEPEERTARRKLIYYIMAISFYSLTFGLLGFLISTAASLIFILRWIERESWKTTLVIAIGSSIVSYFVFSHMLGVALPLGPLERWKYVLRG
jgi:putative tricarboxylic transport membrane protein